MVVASRLVYNCNIPSLISRKILIKIGLLETNWNKWVVIGTQMNTLCLDRPICFKQNNREGLVGPTFFFIKHMTSGKSFIYVPLPEITSQEAFSPSCSLFLSRKQHKPFPHRWSSLNSTQSQIFHAIKDFYCRISFKTSTRILFPILTLVGRGSIQQPTELFLQINGCMCKRLHKWKLFGCTHP
jgi:hypothetical protein